MDDNKGIIGEAHCTVILMVLREIMKNTGLFFCNISILFCCLKLAIIISVFLICHIIIHMIDFRLLILFHMNKEMFTSYQTTDLLLLNLGTTPLFIVIIIQLYL